MAPYDTSKNLAEPTPEGWIFGGGRCWKRAYSPITERWSELAFPDTQRKPLLPLLNATAQAARLFCSMVQVAARDDGLTAQHQEQSLEERDKEVVMLVRTMMEAIDRELDKEWQRSLQKAGVHHPWDHGKILKIRFSMACIDWALQYKVDWTSKEPEHPLSNKWGRSGSGVFDVFCHAMRAVISFHLRQTTSEIEQTDLSHRALPCCGNEACQIADGLVFGGKNHQNPPRIKEARQTTGEIEQSDPPPVDPTVNADTSDDEGQQPTVVSIRNFLIENEWEFREIDDVFVLGFSTEKYTDENGDKGIMVMIGVDSEFDEGEELIEFETLGPEVPKAMSKKQHLRMLTLISKMARESRFASPYYTDRNSDGDFRKLKLRHAWHIETGGFSTKVCLGN